MQVNCFPSKSLPGESTGRLFRISGLGWAVLAAAGITISTGIARPNHGWERSLSASFTAQGGNTKLSSYALALSADYVGDLKVAGMNLTDSEVQLSLGHKRGKLDGELYEDDGRASFLLDIMAQGKFSPFFLSYWAYDSTTSLDERIQLGAGAKYRVVGDLSVSVAYLWEVEHYQGQPSNRQFRLSLRPKYKTTLPSGISINGLLFVQPLVNNPQRFLVDSQVNLSIPTFVNVLSEDKKLDVTVGWREHYNSHPPGLVKKRDSDLSLGLKISF